jgi:hypothetical protein
VRNANKVAPVPGVTHESLDFCERFYHLEPQKRASQPAAILETQRVALARRECPRPPAQKTTQRMGRELDVVDASRPLALYVIARRRKRLEQADEHLGDKRRAISAGVRNLKGCCVRYLEGWKLLDRTVTKSNRNPGTGKKIHCDSYCSN